MDKHFTIRSISFSTLLGSIIGLSLLGYAIISATDNYIMFINLSSFLLVIGGTLAATMIAYSGNSVTRTMISLVHIFINTRPSHTTIPAIVHRLLEFSITSKKQGALGVQKIITASEKNNSLLQFGVALLTAGYTGSDMRKMLNNSINHIFKEHTIRVHIFHTMATFCPSFGMIGTLVGLVIMFEKMGSDISGIGKGMALALLTTLYGVLLAQLLFKPASEKIRQKNESDRFYNQLILEGLCMIAEGADTLTIQDTLNSFIHQSQHVMINKK
jgi:chemotaxis protein MotA